MSADFQLETNTVSNNLYDIRGTYGDNYMLQKRDLLNTERIVIRTDSIGNVLTKSEPVSRSITHDINILA